MMKKVARLHSSTDDQHASVRTTGRIKKPKAVFDPSDNYLPRAQQRMSSVSAVAVVSGVNQSHDRGSSRMSNASSESLSKEVCVVCSKRESKRTSFATKNRLISCLECESKIHRLCLKVDFDDFEELRQKYKCESCSPCSICLKVGPIDNSGTEVVLVCSKCSQMFHNHCLQPGALKVGESQQPRNWKCPKCTEHPQISNGSNMPVKKIREIIGGQVQPAPPSTKSTLTTLKNCPASSESNLKRPLYNDSPKNEEHSASEECVEEQKRTKTENLAPISVDGIGSESRSSNAQSNSLENIRCSPSDSTFDDIPDVKNWSVEQVFAYFQKHFPKEADVFRDHEIDGRSLLLLKRSDVVKKLPLKLGPSLRIYSVILKIQTQLNDNTLGWTI